jgi:hypothetical protein
MPTIYMVVRNRFGGQAAGGRAFLPPRIIMGSHENAKSFCEEIIRWGASQFWATVSPPPLDEKHVRKTGTEFGWRTWIGKAFSSRDTIGASSHYPGARPSGRFTVRTGMDKRLSRGLPDDEAA